MPTTYPIKDYALIGNCETAALVNPHGGIDWLCLPDFDSPALFGALLDRENGGEFFLGAAEPCEVLRREYHADSAILQTRLRTEHGTVLLTDFFVIARRRNSRFYDFTSLHPTRKLVRTARLESGGPVSMRLLVKARPDYGRAMPEWRVTPGGHALPQAALFTNLTLRSKGPDLVSEFLLEPGEKRFAVLDSSEGGSRIAPDLAALARWQATTEAFWQEWNLFNYYRGAHEKIVRRSAVTLKLLTYAPTGAFVAAPTTSLPEAPGGDRNWDYRYTWLRDTALFIDTLFRIGYSGEAKAFLEFVVGEFMKGAVRGDGDETPLQVLYAIRGGRVPDEAELGHLTGYGDARPVRAGNRANAQFQIDTFAHVLEAFFYFQHTGGKLDGKKTRLIESAAETLLARWREPENGIWESVERKLYTYGKVVSWIGLMTAAKICARFRQDAEKTGAEIRTETLRRGVQPDEEGRRFLAAVYDEADIDAAALLAFTSDFLPPEIARATRERIERDLGNDSGALIHRNAQSRDGGEGAFLLCGFWLINHLIKENEISRAETALAGILARLSPLGLLSEEIDPASAEFRGNFPQAFSHLGLIGTILNLEQAKRDPRSHAWSDHERFQRSVGPTIGWRGVVAGFFRVPRTLSLLFGSRSKWKEK